MKNKKVEDEVIDKETKKVTRTKRLKKAKVEKKELKESKKNEKKAKKTEKKELRKKNKTDKEEKKLTKKKAKTKKGKLKKGTLLIVLISVLFVGVGIFAILLGTGIISILPKDNGLKLYVLGEKVKIGDYVEYDAGVWEEDKEIPTRSSAFSFGGYKKDASKNDGVTCNYNEIENKGWRVFSVEDNVVTLIQSGISMCYYHGYGNATNDKSVNILSGNAENINFDSFVDEKFGDSARILSKEDIDKFYEEDASYKRINNKLIKVGNPYWLATKNGSYNLWYVTEGGTVAVNHVGNYGVRVLVTLKDNVMTTGKNKDKIWVLTEEVKKDE